jgi:hypothetical protein
MTTTKKKATTKPCCDISQFALTTNDPPADLVPEIVRLSVADESVVGVEPAAYENVAGSQYATVSSPQAPVAKREGPFVVLEPFASKSRPEGDWPQDTSVHCFWCCHPFRSPPVGLPVARSPDGDGRYHAFGCFCSFECASAWNLDDNSCIDRMYERQVLLHAMARELEGSQRIIRPAPSRLALRMFGGHLEIGEFRQSGSSVKLAAVFPPMLAVNPTFVEVSSTAMTMPLKTPETAPVVGVVAPTKPPKPPTKRRRPAGAAGGAAAPAAPMSSLETAMNFREVEEAQ